MKILQVAFLLLFNYLDSLPKLHTEISSCRGNEDSYVKCNQNKGIYCMSNHRPYVLLTCPIQGCIYVYVAYVSAVKTKAADLLLPLGKKNTIHAIHRYPPSIKVSGHQHR